jgi:hypothetical protein
MWERDEGVIQKAQSDYERTEQETVRPCGNTA